MGWRDNYKVIHPAADALPMMPDEELVKLGEDIEAHRLKEPIKFDAEGRVLDGRNRLEAMERAGIALRTCDRDVFLGGIRAHTSSVRTSIGVTSALSRNRPRRSSPY